MNEKGSVSWYTEAHAALHFPNDQVCCDLCPCLETYARKQCRLTGEYLLDTKFTIGLRCPLEIKEK